MAEGVVILNPSLADNEDGYISKDQSNVDLYIGLNYGYVDGYTWVRTQSTGEGRLKVETSQEPGKLDDVQIFDGYGNPIGSEEGKLNIKVLDPISIGSISDAKKISTLNSTTALLGVSEEFTGQFESTLNASMITTVVFSDQDSAQDGLIIEWSTDGINVDETDLFEIKANKGKQFTFGPTAQFFRIRYINGTTPQTTFRLGTIFHPYFVKSSSHRLIDNLDDNDDAELVKAIIAAKDPASNYINLSSNEFGQLRVVGTVNVAAPPAPGDSDPIQIENATPLSISGSSSVDYEITDGTTFTLSSVALGVEGDSSEKGTKLEVFYVDGGGEHIIERIYASGFTVEKFPNTDQSRDGTLMVGTASPSTGLIRVVRTRLSGGTLEVDGLVRGYEL